MTNHDRMPYGWAMCDCYIWPVTYNPGPCGWCGVIPYESCDEPPDGKATFRGRW